MSASLVGSEMCIRDSLGCSVPRELSAACEFRAPRWLTGSLCAACEFRASPPRLPGRGLAGERA
eukprot:11722198-Alexandrium_andersonii.AAC.1